MSPPGRVAFAWPFLGRGKEGKKAQAGPRDRVAGMRYMNPEPQKAPKGNKKWQPVR
jgi:hypothetical protein